MLKSLEAQLEVASRPGRNLALKSRVAPLLSLAEVDRVDLIIDLAHLVSALSICLVLLTRSPRRRLAELVSTLLANLDINRRAVSLSPLLS